MAMTRAYFSPIDLSAFHPRWQRESNTHINAQRQAVRDKLLTLHHALTPQFLNYMLDLHPHWNQDLIVSPALPAPYNHYKVSQLELAYGKSLSQLTQALENLTHTTLEDHTFKNAVLCVMRVNHTGLHVGLTLGERAWLESTNLLEKIRHNRSNQRVLLQILSDLFTFGYRLKDRHQGSGLGRGAQANQVLQLLRTFQSTTGWLSIERSYSYSSPSLNEVNIGLEMITQLRLLYPLYRFISWSSDNDYLVRE